MDGFYNLFTALLAGIAGVTLGELLRHVRRAKVRIEFDTVEPFFVTSPLELTVPTTDGLTKLQSEGKFLRIRIVNDGSVSARGCRVYLYDAVIRTHSHTATFSGQDPVELYWHATRADTDFTIHRRFYKFADICSTSKDLDRGGFKFITPSLPFRIQKIIVDNRGHFTIKIAVVGENFDPVYQTIEFTVDETWDSLVPETVKSEVKQPMSRYASKDFWSARLNEIKRRVSGS